MLDYLARRAATYLLVLVAALLINFFLPRALPGSPLEDLSSGVGSLAVAPDPATLEALKRYYGLDQPLPRQFLQYLQGLARGDLGFSISYKAPVAKVIWQRIPWTLLLTFSAALLSCLLAVILGTRAALGRMREAAVLLPAVVLDSMPPFVLGSFLLIFLGVKLALFPIGGAYTAFANLAGWEKAVDVLRHAVLPVLALSAHGFFGAYLLVRNSVRLVKDEPYVLLAEVKGLPRHVIHYRYILRMALLPVVTFFSLRVAYALGGAVLVEVLFAYPGLGRLTYEAVLNHDYPLLQGVFFVFTLWVLAVNFLTDLLYLKLDPRIKEV
ncbi:ABC transporter permease [Desulfovirgula thermocuniculi]|uniref:ABC transporter permease n=1 Tax=Desulfovirgula thermocuniculi TaxID=348842 RepID=UPI000411536C|nr:ABC transporter permease [Desulfovirgula thermocuniculi]